MKPSRVKDSPKTSRSRPFVKKQTSDKIIPFSNAVREKLTMDKKLVVQKSNGTSRDPIYKPGWSIPKLRVEDIGVGIIPSRQLSQKSSKSKTSNNSPMQQMKDMLSKFDDAVSNTNIKSAQTKSNRLKSQLRKEEETKVANISINKLESKMMKMRDQFLGDITSELGPGYTSEMKKFQINPKTLAIKFGNPTKTDSCHAVTTKMEQVIKDWSKDAQKVENSSWVKSSGSGTLQEKNSLMRRKPKSRPRVNPGPTLKEYLELSMTGKSSKQLVNSEDKLSEIGQRFRKRLQPIATMDARQLIKTPPEEVIHKMSQQHFKSLEAAGGEGKKYQIKLGPETVGAASIIEKLGPKIRQSRQSQQNLSGLMNFQSLLELRSENEDKVHKPKPKKMAVQPKLSGTEIQCQLEQSVKSLDQAAKLAQNLGKLMTKVTIQQNSAKTNDSSLPAKKEQRVDMIKSTCNKGNEAIKPELCQVDRNPYNPITADIKEKASRLQDVAEKAEQNLKLHSSLWGINNGEKKQEQPKSQIRTNSTIKVSSSTSPTDWGTQTTDNSKKLEKSPANEFQFVSDMSYTDQLMLKKLRNMQPNWKESDQSSVT